MNPPPALPILLALLLAASLPGVAAGSESAQASFDATSVAWSGTSVVSTSLVAATALWPLSTNSPSAADSHFDLQADRVTAAWATTPAYVDVPLAASQGAPPTKDGATYTTAHLEGIRSGNARSLYVFPDGAPSRLFLACASVQVSPKTQVQSVSRVDRSAGPHTADTSHAVEATPCAEPILTGDFTVVLWDWDASVVAKEGSAVLWSGKQQVDQTPVDGRPYASKAQQVTLTVHGGTLTLPTGSQPPQIFVSDLQLAGAPSVTLKDATGTLAGQDLRGSQLQLTGALDGVLVRSADKLSLRVADGLRGVDVDGQAMAVVLPASPARGVSAWLFLGVGAVLAPAVAVPVLQRRRTRPRRVQELVFSGHELVAVGKLVVAEAVTLKALALAPDSAEVHLVRAAVLAALGEPEVALAHHKRAAELIRTDALELRAENAFHAALVAARARPPKHDEVRGWLQVAMEAKPSLRIDADLHPELLPYRPDTALAAVLSELLRP